MLIRVLAVEVSVKLSLKHCSRIWAFPQIQQRPTSGMLESRYLYIDLFKWMTVQHVYVGMLCQTGEYYIIHMHYTVHFPEMKLLDILHEHANGHAISKASPTLPLSSSPVGNCCVCWYLGCARAGSAPAAPDYSLIPYSCVQGQGILHH